MTDSIDDASPIIYFRAPGEASVDAERKFQEVVIALQQKKMLVFRQIFSHEERVPVSPGLRVVIKGSFTEAEVIAAARAVVAALKQEFK